MVQVVIAVNRRHEERYGRLHGEGGPGAGPGQGGEQVAGCFK